MKPAVRLGVAFPAAAPSFAIGKKVGYRNTLNLRGAVSAPPIVFAAGADTHKSRNQA